MIHTISPNCVVPSCVKCHRENYIQDYKLISNGKLLEIFKALQNK